VGGIPWPACDVDAEAHRKLLPLSHPAVSGLIGADQQIAANTFTECLLALVLPQIVKAQRKHGPAFQPTAGIVLHDAQLLDLTRKVLADVAHGAVPDGDTPLAEDLGGLRRRLVTPPPDPSDGGTQQSRSTAALPAARASATRRS
jgi:hypothetical protein